VGLSRFVLGRHRVSRGVSARQAMWVWPTGDWRVVVSCVTKSLGGPRRGPGWGGCRGLALAAGAGVPGAAGHLGPDPWGSGPRRFET